MRFAALGGLEEIGRNMMFFEYENEILIIDIGLQFPEEETPGIDFIIPNVTYLEKKKAAIKGIILTHAHYDHIGGIPYLMGRLGNPTIYTTQLTREIVNKRQQEALNAPQLKYHIVKSGDRVSISPSFEAEFFDVTHTIPDTIGVTLHTPVGIIVHPGEYKLDRETKNESKTLDAFKNIAKKHAVYAFLQDSTNADRPGVSVPEREVRKNIEIVFKKADGRLILATFASLLDRLYEIIKIAEKLGRVVAISGYSMKNNIQIAQNLGYMKFDRGTIVNVEDARNIPDNKLLILCTGAQGEPNASLMRIVNGEHRHIQIKPGDTVLFSSSIIPGNERGVQTLKDNLARQGARVYTSQEIDIHSSGHAPADEISEVIKTLQPKFYVPIHGFYFKRHANAELAAEAGVPRARSIVVDNGEIVEFTKDTARATGETVPASYVFVDGLGVGDVGEVVLRDRRTLAQEGMVVVIAAVGRRSGKMIKNPDIISRGFIYLKENKEILDEVRRKIRSIIGRIPSYQDVDPDYLKGLIRDQIGEYLYNKTKRRPMILPVIIEV